jgi:hypothetical protein
LTYKVEADSDLSLEEIRDASEAVLKANLGKFGKDINVEIQTSVKGI